MSEYLSDEEQVERLKSWWNENGTFLVVGLLVTILAIGGWNYYGSYKDEVGEKSSQSYRDYLELEKDSRSEAAEKLTEEFLNPSQHIWKTLSDWIDDSFNERDMVEAYIL